VVTGEVLWKRAYSLLPFDMEAIEEEMHCLHFNKSYLFCKSKCCFIMYYTAVKKIVKHAY